MSRLISLLRQRWVFSIFGLIALAVMIWFFGPYISIAGYEPLKSPAVRMLVILILFALWGLNYLRKQLKAARASKQLSNDLSKPDAQVDAAQLLNVETADEAKLLKERFDEAMEILRKSRRKGGTGGLYELPWYVIIGPPGSGKTTALINSGLEFPLAGSFGKAALRGVGGTRNCDWWFTDQAVLLDTAGRYLTQDSHAAVDSAAWLNFLNLLKKHRKRRPVNGVLVAISLADLMQQDSSERKAHEHAIRQRIQELYKHFNITLPVYVLLTKADLVAGFTEFFDDLGNEDRSQVWGMTLPLDDEPGQQDIGMSFAAEFDLLLQRLDEGLLARLSQERDVHRRTLIYRFPRQMASLKDVISQFLDGVFQPNRYEKPMLLRGIYLTSGTQEGTPIDRLMGTMARAFGLDQQLLPSFGGRGKSYFITRLLKQVVFAESGLAGYNRRLETRRVWLQRGAYSGVLIVTLAMALAWLTSYSANSQHVGQVADSLADYEEVETAEHEATLTGLLPQLDALKSIIDSASQHEAQVPLHMRLWLYQGDGLADAAKDAYIRELNTKFMPLISEALEQQLKHSAGNPELEYETLKTYLMLGNPERLDAQHLEQWMALNWQKTFAGRQDVQTRLNAHLHELLQTTIRPITLDKRLVKSARKDLSRVSLAGVIYGRLKSDARTETGATFRLTDLGGGSVPLVFMRASGTDLDEEIPGLYTYQGFHEFFESENKRLAAEVRAEDWVLGAEQNDQLAKRLKGLDREIERLYMADYINIWSALLSDLRIVPFRDIQHATQVVEVLSGPASPMVSLLEAVRENTELSRSPVDAEKITENMKKNAPGARRIKRLLGSTLDDQAVPGSDEIFSNPVDLRFKTLNGLTDAAGGGQPKINKVITLLSELYGQLSVIQDGQQTGALGMSRDGSGLNNTVQRLQTEAARQPEPVKTWLLGLARNSQMVAMGSQREQINESWTANIGPQCRKALNNRYPFNKDNLSEVTIDDFGRVFAPGGLLDVFFQEHLKSLVDTSQHPWRWRSVEDEMRGSSDTVLLQFQRAAAIRDAFFQFGGQRPQVHFSLKPIYLDAQTTRFALDIDGQKMEYRHGPARASNAQWPGPSGSSQARIVFETKDGAQAVLSDDGPWAWFRLLDQAKVEITTPDRFLVTFKAGERETRYEIRANSVINPFVMKELQAFQCPEAL
jgi:type VI secretion system protein ImpL